MMAVYSIRSSRRPVVCYCGVAKFNETNLVEEVAIVSFVLKRTTGSAISLYREPDGRSGAIRPPTRSDHLLLVPSVKVLV
jgi:hypothetical protein